jgi:hypothetical protein
MILKPLTLTAAAVALGVLSITRSAPAGGGGRPVTRVRVVPFRAGGTVAVIEPGDPE